MKEIAPKPDISRKITLDAIPGIPLIEADDNIGEILQETFEKNNISLQNKDIVVIAQKIISKSEGRYANLKDYAPSPQAIEISQKSGRDPRLVQLIINESQFIRWVMPGTPQSPGIVVVKHRIGHVCSGAGIDATNTGCEDKDLVLLLPEDPNRSAKAIASHFYESKNVQIGVIIIDTLGDHDRIGSIGKAIGLANVPARLVKTGIHDLDGKSDLLSDLALADNLAGMAMIAMGDSDAGSPVVLVRGVDFPITSDAKIQDVFVQHQQ